MKENVPVTNGYGETSLSGIYAAGDVSGIEEASSAMIEGRIAGADAAYQAGYLTEDAFEAIVSINETSLGQLRQGMFGPDARGVEQVTTDEGITLSASLLEKGYLEESEISGFPGVQTKQKGIYPVIECTQNIPCNPCQDACVKGCISIGDTITSLPVVGENVDCTGCGLCVASCSGQSIFLIEEKPEEDAAYVSMPYEFLPLPEKGDKGLALSRRGDVVCETEIIKLRSSKAMDKTNILTIKVPLSMAMKARFFKPLTEGGAKNA